MASLDRPAIIELLGRLGAESEQTIVQAARELHAKVGESGLTWDDLLRPDSEIGGRARISRAICARTSPTSSARSPTTASMRRIAAMSARSRSASEPERAARPSGPAAELRRLMLQGNRAKGIQTK
jgi:hypothetical protein